MMRAPSRIAAETLCAHVVERLLAGPAPPSATGYRQRITAARMPCLWPRTSWSGSTLISLDSSSLRRIGCGSTIWRHESAFGLSRSPSGPTVPCRLVTTSSRMASSGGLVTWANSCWK